MSRPRGALRPPVFRNNRGFCRILRLTETPRTRNYKPRAVVPRRCVTVRSRRRENFIAETNLSAPHT